MTGNKLSKEHRLKLSLAKRGKRSNAFKGENNVNKLLRGCRSYIHWRKEIFRKDNFICQRCKKRGGKLEVHHIVPFRKLVKIYSINNIEQGCNCEQLWNENLGITLCFKCHKKVDIKRKHLSYRKNKKGD